MAIASGNGTREWAHGRAASGQRRPRGLEGRYRGSVAGCRLAARRVHFVGNCLALVPKSAAQMVAAPIRTVFTKPDPASAPEQWRKLADTFRERYPRLAQLLDDADPEILAYQVARYLETHISLPRGCSSR